MPAPQIGLADDLHAQRPAVHRAGDQRAAEPGGRAHRVPAAANRSSVDAVEPRKRDVAAAPCSRRAGAGARPLLRRRRAGRSRRRRFSGPSSQALHQLFNDYWEWRLATEPELATSVGRREHNGRWSDLSRGGARPRARRAAGIPRARDVPVARHADAVRSAERAAAGVRAAHDSSRPSRCSTLIADGVAGWTARTTASSGPSSRCRRRRLADYENILARLRGLPALRGPGDRAAWTSSWRRVWRSPAVVVDLMLDQVVVAARARRRSSRRCWRRSPRFPTSMAGSTQRRLRASAVGRLPAAVRAQLDAPRDLSARSLPAAGRAAGRAVGSLPNGAAAYARLVRYFTTTRMSPDEIHQLGLKEVDRIEARDAGDCRRVRLHRHASPSSSASWPTGRACEFESEDEMLAYAEDVLASVRPVMPTLFLRAAAGRGARAADSARSRRLDGVQLHRRHRDGVAPRATST